MQGISVFLIWQQNYFCSKWELATLVYIWREPPPLATKVALSPEEKHCKE
jgi:hypothetical protein